MRVKRVVGPTPTDHTSNLIGEHLYYPVPSASIWRPAHHIVVQKYNQPGAGAVVGGEREERTVNLPGCNTSNATDCNATDCSTL